MKPKREKIQLLLMCICLVILSACEYDYVKYEITPAPDNVSFSNDIMPIFNSSCNMGGCHNGSGPSPDLTPAGAYDDLFAENLIDTISPANSQLVIKLNGPGTHDGRSEPQQRVLIEGWIEQGAKDN